MKFSLRQQHHGEKQEVWANFVKLYHWSDRGDNRSYITISNDQSLDMDGTWEPAQINWYACGNTSPGWTGSFTQGLQKAVKIAVYLDKRQKKATNAGIKAIVGPGNPRKRSKRKLAAIQAKTSTSKAESRHPR